MRMVKVRILPPQPISPSRNDGSAHLGRFSSDCATFSSGPIPCFQPETKYQLGKGMVMTRKAEATLWMRVKIGERSAMKRLAKKGRSYVPDFEGPCKPG